MKRWTPLFILLAFLPGGCAEQDTTLSGVHFFDFHADWCGPCKMQTPIIKRLEKDFTSVTFHHVNIDVQSDLAREYKVSAIPCMVITVDGKEKKRFSGLSRYEDLSAELSRYRDGTATGSNARIQREAEVAARR